MRIRVLFFGMLKDLAGIPEDRLEVPEGATAGAVFDRYAERFPRMREMASSIVMARNHEFTPASQALADGDEVAFLPPVSGGSRAPAEICENGNFFAVTRQVIDTREAIDRILRGEDGAVVTFEGVARNNTRGRLTRYLEYEGYEPMAVKKMAEIGRDLCSRFAIDHVAMIHRLGRLLIGEASVAVIVTAPHRKPAFEAALEGINVLKRLVPVWKKEHFADGEVWVEGEWDQRAPVLQPR